MEWVAETEKAIGTGSYCSIHIATQFKSTSKCTAGRKYLRHVDGVKPVVVGIIEHTRAHNHNKATQLIDWNFGTIREVELHQKKYSYHQEISVKYCARNRILQGDEWSLDKVGHNPSIEI